MTALTINASFPISQLDDLFAMNAMPTDERARMAQDVHALRCGLAARTDPWDRNHQRFQDFYWATT
jgi:hypothetical protein